MHTGIEVSQTLRALLVRPHTLERDVQHLAVVYDLLLKQSRSIRDIFLIRLLSVLEREWVFGYLRRRRCHNIYDQDKLRQALNACLEFSPCFGLAWQRQQRP